MEGRFPKGKGMGLEFSISLKGDKVSRAEGYINGWCLRPQQDIRVITMSRISIVRFGLLYIMKRQ